MLRRSLAYALLVLACAPDARAQTAFTYQGELKLANVAVNAPVSMEFKLFDALANGQQVGATLIFNGQPGNQPLVNVAAGRFTAALDFGIAPFTGARRWLEIKVDNFVMVPRQEVTAAPLALFAARPWATVGSDVTRATGRVGVGVATPGAALDVAGLGPHPVLRVVGQFAAPIELTAGPGVAIGDAGAQATLAGGEAGPGGPAGDVRVEAGHGNPGPNPSNGGSVRIIAGDGFSAGDGGDVVLTPGAGDNPGQDGVIRMPGNPADGAGVVVNQNGQVGIGQPAPAAELDVVGGQDVVRVQADMQNDATAGKVAERHILKLGNQEPERAPDISPERFAAGQSEGYAAATPAVIGDRARGVPPVSPNTLPVVGCIWDADDIAVWATAPYVNSRAVQGHARHGIGVYGTTNITSPPGVLDGEPGPSPNPDAIGVKGYSYAGTGVVGESPNGQAGRFIGHVTVSETLAVRAPDAGGFDFAVNGTAGKLGGGEWGVYSDARLKQNIAPLAGALDRLLRMHGYVFEYTPSAIEDGRGLPGPQIGLLADEVERVFPDWVGCDNDGYAFVSIRGATALIIESLRQLRTESDERLAAQADRVAALERENRELKVRLERLERLLTP